MTLRQPRKYKRINGSCQLDSIQKINPPGWPIPCSPQLALLPILSAPASPASRKFSSSISRLRRKIAPVTPSQNGKYGPVQRIKRLSGRLQGAYINLAASTRRRARTASLPLLRFSRARSDCKPFHHCLRHQALPLYPTQQRTYTAYV